MNPRDTAANMNRRRMIRRGATYGPHLAGRMPPDDGVERGIAAFVICASLIRQFEFAQNVWVNDRNFHELGNERDPIIGNQDGTLEFKIPKRPIRKTIKGCRHSRRCAAVPTSSFPGLKALRFLCAHRSDAITPGARCRSKNLRPMHRPAWHQDAPTTRSTSRESTRPAAGRVSIYWTWSYPGEANRDTSELDNRFSTMTEVRRVEWPSYETPECGEMLFQQGIAGALELFLSAWCRSSSSSPKSPGIRSPSFSVSTRPASTAARRARARGHGHAAGVRPGSHVDRAGGRTR